MERIKQELEDLNTNGQFRIIPDIKTKSDGIINIEGKDYINLASNDYLGISTKKDLYNEFILYNNECSFSSASARLLSGSSSIYNMLERNLADLFNKDSALIFNTGYQCNLGVISTLCQRGDVVLSDKLNHASIIDGMRLAEGDFFRYNHLDYEHLEKILKNKRNFYKRAIIVSESVFSMDGDVANIDKLIELKNKYNCLLMIDEAHAFCATGKGLAGISEHKDVDIITATFGKALGSFGAFCVSNSDIIKYLTNKARSFIFSTSIPPINIAWTNWLLTNKLDYIRSQKENLQIITKQTHDYLSEIGFTTPSITQIIPVIIGSNSDTLKISEKLKSEGYYIPAIRPPTVKEGSSRLRISLTADIKFDEIKRVLDIIREFLT